MEHKLYCKQYCNILSVAVKEVKKLYYKEIVTKSKHKIKTTCNIVRIVHKEICKCANVSNIKSLRTNNHKVYNQISIANEFNNYFSNTAESTGIKGVNEKAKDSFPLQYLFKYFKQPFKAMNWPDSCSKEINKIIDSLKSKNSGGYEEITTDVIKISEPFIISPIINICNKLLAHGVYHEGLKCSLVRPIYKSGDKSAASNYRPISLLPVSSKIFEKVTYNRLFDHLNKNAIYNKYQYGF
jgi:hypothetical protein